MWLFIPGEASRSARAPAGSSSASTSRSRATAPCVMSSKTPMPRPLSWPGWKTRPWIARLSGTISAPSTAARGAALWISSVRAIPASPSAPAERWRARATRATSGRTSAASSARPRPSGSSSRTSAGICDLVSAASPAIFDRWVSEVERDYSRRLRSERARRGGAYSCWPTPTVSSVGTLLFVLRGRCVWSVDGRKGQLTLNKAVAIWTMRRGLPRSYRPSRQVLKSWRLGKRCARHVPKLSPRFLEHLMGWPIGWDRCRLAGNGVVPLAAAHAFRILRARLS